MRSSSGLIREVYYAANSYACNDVSNGRSYGSGSRGFKRNSEFHENRQRRAVQSQRRQRSQRCFRPLGFRYQTGDKNTRRFRQRRHRLHQKHQRGTIHRNSRDGFLESCHKRSRLHIPQFFCADSNFFHFSRFGVYSSTSPSK